MQAEQQNLAALKQQEVAVTQAETAKKTTIIDAQAEAARKKEAATGEAEALKVSSAGQADAQNQALNGEELQDTVRKLVASIAEPIKKEATPPAGDSISESEPEIDGPYSMDEGEPES